MTERGPKVVFVKNEPLSFEEVRELAAECIEHPASHKIRHEFRVATNPENVLRILDRLEELEAELSRLRGET